MIRRFLDPQAATALVDVDLVHRHATCPLCFTTNVSMSALAAGGGWRCIRCGQRWDARRLAVVAAYAGWAFELANATCGVERTLSPNVAGGARVLPFSANRTPAV
jgi:hypothetical protein